ncbi:MAG: hypothetical protein HC802_04430 [Caldilineaceae bacterium]|nr:hypothetical protein [Caldilineaceae bacterium]
MPVETFATFVVEQAVGIAVGAVAVAIAPKVGPKLSDWRYDIVEGAKTAIYEVQDKSSRLVAMTAVGGNTAIESGAGDGKRDRWQTTALVATGTGAATAAATAVIANPVADSARNAYATMAGGVVWYGEQWSDLFHEAHESVFPNASTSAKEVLAGLGEAKVISDLPGRARVRVGALRGNDVLAGQVAEALVSVKGVEQVQANANTGSLLVNYDGQRFGSLDSLLESLAG